MLRPPTLIALGLLAMTSTGCVYWRSAETPMPSVVHRSPAENADTLVVLLPGMGDEPADFETHGFVAELQRQAPHCDVIAADAHFGYYRDRTLLDRLHADVLLPNAGRYEHVWLVGISLGGFGASIYTHAHPDAVDGVIMLAPFLGDDEVIARIRNAGGLARWQPPTPAELAALPRDLELKTLEIWSVFKDLTSRAETPNATRLFLGWGTDDSFHDNIAMIAASLPATQTVSRTGGHSWTVWEPVFAELVGRALSR
ncbi:MAG: alpha/beta hydrolase [bacterium]|nr:alpha/beta hydrolase [bacterium]